MELSSVLTIIGLLLKFTTVYFAYIALRWMFIKPKEWLQARPTIRFAVVIAARNEQAVIGRLVSSLLDQDYPRELFDVFVVPNNCTDDTAGEAFRAGANILLCDYPVRQKGDALRQAFFQLEKRDYDAYVVFDADNVVDRHYLQRTNDAFSSGAEVVKGRQVALDPKSSWISGCYDIYFCGFDRIFNRPRANAGLSAKLVGTGFAVHRTALEKLGGWDTQTIAEDAEFAAQCALCDIPVAWAPQAVTFDEEPDDLLVSIHQRKRWCSGVIQVGRLMLPQLLVFGHGKLCRDLCFFLLTSQLAPVSLLLMLMSRLLDPPGVTALLLGTACSWIACSAGAVVLLLLERPAGRRNYCSALLFPLFMLTWAPLQVLALFRNTTHWREIRHGSVKRSAL